VGAYLNIYVGSYMVVPKIDGTIEKKFTSCLNAACKCEKEIQTKFCPECGVKTTEQIKYTPCKISAGNFDDIFDDWHDELYSPHNGGTEIDKNVDFYIPRIENKKDKRKMGIVNIDYNESGGKDLTGINTSSAIILFQIKYKKYIDAIIEDGGNPEFCYGVFTHYI
jgi:hypothetical protein